MIEIFFAGLWAEIWRYGLGAGLIITCVLGWYFSPVFKKEFLAAAAVVAAFTIAFAFGVSTGEKRVQAQWDASLEAAANQADKARAGAVRDVGRSNALRLPNDRYDRSQRGQR